MKQTNEIIIAAPFKKIFSAASDLARWPEFLPHYRYNRFLSHTPSGGIVKMSCLRSGWPTTWVSEYRIDTEKHQLHFRHLKSAFHATEGMEVVWNFSELANGSVRVRITHDLKKHLVLIGPAASEWLIGKFFIHHIATKTLAGLKRKVEAQATSPVCTIDVKSKKIDYRKNQAGSTPSRKLKPRKTAAQRVAA